MNRTFVIGDIHGALRALQQLLQLIQPAAGDKFIFLGDFVDGWSQSAEVIEFLLQFSKDYDCIFLKGNHDEDCRLWLQHGEITDIWLGHGGLTTMKSYESVSADDKKKHIGFLNALLDYYVDAEDRLFIHAGFSNRRGPEYEHYKTNFTWDRTLIESALAMDKALGKTDPFYPKRLLLFKEIYIGHTPTTDYGYDQPLNAANLWDIDTGAAFTGRLTAMNIDTKEIFQSDTVMYLYPDEKGRNK